ncbi:hypothetical protein RE474_09655 [Methanolobus sediminis]|uniref:Uncharacterized protein n=1 Tax=Methanolobus sediminis TaxID=3072978 RepID=A0AA51UIY4_9EURY|nr:hypothetical protein [Methanolobus sediminis]WMW24354.1 hypothetical protein RE474_09655 [Methanolobus sediminis]
MRYNAIIYVNTISQRIISCIDGNFIEHMTYLNKNAIDECVDAVALECGLGTDYHLRYID